MMMMMVHHRLTKSTMQLIPVKYITINLKEAGRKEMCGVKMVCKSAESCYILAHCSNSYSPLVTAGNLVLTTGLKT